MSTLLSRLLDLTPVRPDSDRDPTSATSERTYTTVVDPAFTIGPKVHGGTLQMVGARAAYRAFVDGGGDADIRPLAVTTDFLAAPDAAEISLRARVRKRGATVSVAEVDVCQGDRLVATNTVVLGRADTGSSRHSDTTSLHALPVQPPPGELDIASSPIGDIMHFGAALDLVVRSETLPLLRGEHGPPIVQGWVRPKDAEPDLDFATLVCDISPPVVMNLGLTGWAPTVQLTTYLRRHPAPGWLRVQSSSTEIGRGMFEEDHVVIDSTGTVVAQSRQLALIPTK